MGLAYIGLIKETAPIEGADRIHAATVVCGEGGIWKGVCPKTIVTGQKVMVFLQDALLPKTEAFAFMEKHGYRVKIQKLKGVPSECLIMECDQSAEVGTDVTFAMGVEKYEAPLPAGTNAVGNFPIFVPKTDEVNFQSVPGMVEALRGQPFYATLKYDGTSSTVYRWKGDYGVCSRRLKVAEDDPRGRVAAKYGLPNSLPEGYAVQFETYGDGWAKNPLGIKGVNGAAFDVWNIAEQRYLNFIELKNFLESIKFPMVDVLFTGFFDWTDDQIRCNAEGIYPSGKQREGIVIRSTEGLMYRDSRISFKSINALYK